MLHIRGHLHFQEPFHRHATVVIEEMYSHFCSCNDVFTLTENETYTKTNKMGTVPNDIGSGIGLGLGCSMNTFTLSYISNFVSVSFSIDAPLVGMYSHNSFVNFLTRRISFLLRILRSKLSQFPCCRGSAAERL